MIPEGQDRFCLMDKTGRRGNKRAAEERAGRAEEKLEDIFELNNFKCCTVVVCSKRVAATGASRPWDGASPSLKETEALPGVNLDLSRLADKLDICNTTEVKS